MQRAAMLGNTSVAALDGTPHRYAAAMVVQSARLLNKNEANGETAIRILFLVVDAIKPGFIGGWERAERHAS